MPTNTLPATAGAADVSPRPCLPPPAPTPYGSTVERLAIAAELHLGKATERTRHALESALADYRRQQSEERERAAVEAARLARRCGLEVGDGA